MCRYKLAIFDCDGVLFDSSEANRAYYNKILEQFGFGPMSEEEFSYVHMHTAADSLAFLFRNRPELIPDAMEYAVRIGYDPFIPLMEMEPGVVETLETIRPKIKTAISTNRSTTMPRLIETFNLNKWFDTIVCALDVERAKPDPEGVFKILAELKVDRDQSIYIGDSKVDEQVASNAGIPLIAYKNPELDAEYHVSHFQDIASILLM